MNRLLLASLAIVVAAGTARAQQPAPSAAPAAPASLTGGLKRSWDNIKRNVSEAAEKMPEANYSFKPTPDVRSFGGLVGHVAASQYGTCARLKGDAVPEAVGGYEKLATKAELVKAMQDSIAFCDGVYGSMTDESVLKPTKLGQNEVIPVNTLWGNISHSNEHYGNMVTYMRLKGLVPPSTERAQQPQPKKSN
jgi:uncharacterized damage-inducible protein DinB